MEEGLQKFIDPDYDPDNITPNNEWYHFKAGIWKYDRIDEIFRENWLFPFLSEGYSYNMLTKTLTIVSEEKELTAYVHCKTLDVAKRFVNIFVKLEISYFKHREGVKNG